MTEPSEQLVDGEPVEAVKAGPIFVVGSMRSGSTLLRLILDSHPNIAIGGETGFVGALLATKTVPNWKYGTDWYQRLDWTEAEFDARLRDFFGGLFNRYAEGQGKQRWGEKTPFHTAHMGVTARVFPDATFVGIVRHPGAVAASLRKSFHYTFHDALSYWSATNLDMVRAATELGPRFVLCRYEDLVVEGEPVLRELVAAVGEPWVASVLSHHRVQRDKGAPRVADGSTIAHDPIDAKRAAQWAESASAEDFHALEGISALAGFFGYDFRDPAACDRLLTDSGARVWLPTGDDVAQRRREWEDMVDFEERPRSLAIEANPDELAMRLSETEQALARVRSRRTVQISEALRRVKRGRSLDDLRHAWVTLRNAMKEKA